MNFSDLEQVKTITNFDDLIGDKLPLNASIFCGNVEVIDYLITKCDVNKINPITKATPLYMAYQMKDINTFKKLVEAGADINQEPADINFDFIFDIFMSDDQPFKDYILSLPQFVKPSRLYKGKTFDQACIVDEEIKNNLIERNERINTVIKITTFLDNISPDLGQEDLGQKYLDLYNRNQNKN